MTPKSGTRLFGGAGSGFTGAKRSWVTAGCAPFKVFFPVVFIAINVSLYAGDPAYKGLRYCIVKYPKTKLCSLIHRPLPPGAKCNCPKGRLPAEREYNWIFDGVRSRVEKIIGQVVHHKVRLNLSYFVFPFSHIRALKAFNNIKNRTSYNIIVASVNLTCHLTALWTRMYPQFRGYSNGPHFS